MPGQGKGDPGNRVGARASRIQTIIPVAIGLFMAILLITGINVAQRYCHRHPIKRWQLSALFTIWSLICAGWSVLPWVVGDVTPARRRLVSLMMVLQSALFAWAALG